MVSAISDRLSRLKSNRYIVANEASSDSTIVNAGTSVAQVSRRNSRTTRTTRTTVRTSVNSTSCTEARMVVVRSMMVSILIAGGMTVSSFGSNALTRSTVSMTFAPGCLKTDRVIAASLS
jgi:lambda repressor-like predicted transcriptional regulator